MLTKMVRADTKGRIALGHLADEVSGFSVTKNENNRELYIEIAAHEKWLFSNKIALKNIENGIEDAKLNRLSEKGGFSRYIDNEGT